MIPMMLENIMDPYFVSGIILNVLLYSPVSFSLKPYDMSVLFFNLWQKL